jgi:Ion transport protein
MFRILRALRLISRAEGLRIGLQALLQAIPNVLRIVAIMVLFFIIFGIIAIGYFKGRFCECINEWIDFPMDENHQLNYKWDCINGGGEWIRRYYNFDNMYQAIASLFIISNVAGWTDFMYIGARVTEIDQVWVRWTHPS